MRGRERFDIPSTRSFPTEQCRCCDLRHLCERDDVGLNRERGCPLHVSIVCSVRNLRRVIRNVGLHRVQVLGSGESEVVEFIAVVGKNSSVHLD